MLNVRITCPSDRTDDVLDTLRADEGVAQLTVHRGASIVPEGDVVVADLARESADGVVDRLRAAGVERHGTITATESTFALSDRARSAERAAPGAGSDAVLWAALERQTEDDSELTWSFLTFLTIATMLAGVAVVLDSPILVVGAMVLGPEFGPIARICVGLLRRRASWVGTGAARLVGGFALAVAVTLLLALVARAAGWIDLAMLDHRPLTGFVVSPDKWSFVVALLAGCAGVLALTAGRSSTLVGVFISVTTVPAAGNIAVAAALGSWHQVGGSAVQLGVNVLGMVVAGVVTLFVQRTVWARVRRRWRRTRA